MPKIGIRELAKRRVAEFYQRRYFMSPPRKPRGEKPATTIRILQRQLANHQHVINQQRLTIADKEKVIAGYDVQLSEAQETSDYITQSAIARRERYEAELAAARIDAVRLAYLEGYFYAKEGQAPISTARAPILRDPAETNPRSGAGDSKDFPHRRRDPAQERDNESQARSAEGFSGTLRRERRDHQDDPRRQAVEHVEITQGRWRHFAERGD